MSAPDRRGSCAGKKQYLTFSHAEHDAHNTSRHTGEPHIAYHCRLCHYAHVGSRPPRIKLRGKDR